MSHWHQIRTMWRLMSALEKNDTRSAHPAGDDAVDLKPALWLLKDSIRALGWKYLAFVLGGLGFGLVALLPAELFRYFTQSTQRLDALNAQEFFVRLGFFGGVVALSLAVASVGTTLLQEWLRLRVEADLRRRVLCRLHQTPLSVLDGAQRGDWLTRMTGDLGNVESFLTEAIPGQIRQLAILVGSGTLFAYHSGALVLVPLATALVLAILNAVVQVRLAPVLMELRGLHGGVFQLLIESLEGVRTIRSHAVEPYVERRFDGKLREITVKSLSMVGRLGSLIGANEFVGQIMVTASLTLAAWSLSAGRLTVETVLIYPFFIGMFYGSAQGLASAAYSWNRFFAEGGRLAQILAEEPISTKASVPGELSLRRLNAINVYNLTVGHPEGKLIGPITSSFNVGEVWCVMGASGCGKSTMLEVMAGLRPGLSGYFRMDDRAPAPLWQSDESLLPQFPVEAAAYVEQRPYIFEGTLQENLTFGNPQRLSDTVIWNALDQAGLYEFVSSCGGLQFYLRDRGKNLSEGERYRIAFCRALLLDRPFLLLDEPFAALDERSVQTVVTTINSLRERRGIIAVTHYVPENFKFDGLIRFETTRVDVKGPTHLRTLTEERR